MSVALVTGASSGTGRVLAQEDGYAVGLLARLARHLPDAVLRRFARSSGDSPDSKLGSVRGPSLGPEGLDAEPGGAHPPAEEGRE